MSSYVFYRWRCLREHTKRERSQLSERAWLQDLDGHLDSLSLCFSILSSHFYLAFLTRTMIAAKSSFSSALNLFGGKWLSQCWMIWIQWQDIICSLLAPVLEKRDAMVPHEPDVLSPVEDKHTEYGHGCPGPISVDCSPLPGLRELLWVTSMPVIKLLFLSSKSLPWTLLCEAGGWVLANGIIPWTVWHGSVSKTELQPKPGWPNLAVTARLVVQIPGTKSAEWFLEIHIQTGVQASATDL